MVSSQKQLIAFFFILCALVLFFSRETAYENTTSFETNLITHADGASEPQTITPLSSQGTFNYLEITASCGPDFEGHCIPAYAGPGTSYEHVADLRNGMLLKVKDTVRVDGQTWYRVYFDEWLRYPDRVNGDWYIPAVSGRLVRSDGLQVVSTSTPKTSKRIVVDLSDHTIYAYDGTALFLSTKVATGIDEAPTPVGTFSIYKKTPSRYMQGPLPGVSDVPFDLPGVSWNMYFTQDGAVIHGAYWHDRYGTNQSDGCVNIPPEIAKILYDWAPLGTTVTIRN